MSEIRRYAAGIVLYNPDLDRLKENIDAITPQVNTVYCFNNGLLKDKETKEFLRAYDSVVLLGEGINLGVATALNKILDKASEDKMEWILTLDQDSVVSGDMISALASLTKERDVAIICPQIEDVRRKNKNPVHRSNTMEDVDFCITSGSFMNIKTTLKIGGFDDYLFIGLVDDEMSYRVKLNGYRIIRSNAVVLNHELGNLTPAKHEKLWLKLGTILHSETIKKLSYRREVSSMRLYYATRNMIYLKRRYKKYVNASYWNKRLIFNSASSFIRGGRLDVLGAILAGIGDGRAVKVVPFVATKSQ